MSNCKGNGVASTVQIDSCAIAGGGGGDKLWCLWGVRRDTKRWGGSGGARYALFLLHARGIWEDLVPEKVKLNKIW